MRLPGLDIPFPAALSDAGRSAAEGVLALAAGLLLARLVWLAAGAEAPLPLIATAAAAEPAAASSILEAANPFQPGAVIATSLAAVPTSLNLQLTGLRSAAEDEQGGTAVIILPDGQQKRFSTGDIIVPGAVLEAVTPDRVFLRVNGQLEELTRQIQPMRSFAVPGEARIAAPQATASAATAARNAAAAEPKPVTPSLLMTDVSLQPEFRDGAVTGYRMSPRGAGHFEAAGLEPGDLVLRINGQSVEGLRPDMIQSAISSNNEVALDVVRSGAIVRMRLTGETGLSQ